MGSSDKMLVSLSALLLALISSTSALKAVCTFNGEGSGEVTGDILLIEHETPDGTEIEISGELMNLSPGEHGFHIHENGDLSDNCKGAGGHYNPFGLNHGAPGAEERHVGDLGNVVASDEMITFSGSRITWSGSVGTTASSTEPSWSTRVLMTLALVERRT